RRARKSGTLRRSDLQAAADPFPGAIFRLTACHPERSRGIQCCYLHVSPRDPSTPLGMTRFSLVASFQPDYTSRMETSVEKLVAPFFLVTGPSHIFQPRARVPLF